MLRVLRHTIILIVLLFVQLHNVKSEVALYPEATIFTQEGDFFLHMIEKGETLHLLSKKYNVKIDDILAVNPGLSVKTFYYGKKIRIPGKNATISNEEKTETKQKTEPEKTEITTTPIVVPEKIVVSENNSFHKTLEFNIIRFDIDLYQYLNKQIAEKEFLYNYNKFLKTYGEKIIGIGKFDSDDFFKRFNDFFAEPTLTSLYEDVEDKFRNTEFISGELNPALDTLFKEFPALIRPSIYTHVSGLNQSVVVTDDVLSVSLDKYMGSDYPLYKNYFHNYQLQNMSPDRIVPDYLLGFMLSNLPFQGREDVLLDRMIYEGKLRYILARLLPYRKVREFMGYSEEQYNWCTTNQVQIWKNILRNGHLYTPDYMTTAKYINNAPYTVTVSTESPGGIGIWVGFQIVDAYMKKHQETTLSQLMNMQDSRQLLIDSKYKP